MEKHTLNGENDKATFVGKSFREAKTFADETISIIRSLLNDDSFKNEHRTASKFFSRKYKLDFVTVI